MLELSLLPMNGGETSDDRRKLLQLLRTIRLEAGLTQEELARRLGKPQSYVSKYESGERRLDILEVRDVANAVGLELGHVVRMLEADSP